MSLIFDEKTHTYTYDGIIIKSVTQALQGAGLNDYDNVPKEILEPAAKFGIAVHRMTELFDHKTLNLNTLDPGLAPYLVGYEKFLNDFDIEYLEIELRMFSKKYMYAGTVDRIARINRDERLTIVDFKTGILIKPHALQLAAYEKLYLEATKTRQRLDRMSVKIEPNDYKIKRYDDKGDFNIFLSALNVANWKGK